MSEKLHGIYQVHACVVVRSQSMAMLEMMHKNRMMRELEGAQRSVGAADSSALRDLYGSKRLSVGADLPAGD